MNQLTASSSAWTFFLFSNNSNRLALNVLWRIARKEMTSLVRMDSVPDGMGRVSCTPEGRLDMTLSVV